MEAQIQTECLVESVNHTSFTVTDLDRVLSFLCDGLGLRLLDLSPRDPKTMQLIVGVKGVENVTAFVQAPGHRIELIKYSKPDDLQIHVIRPCDTGSSHLAFNVKDIDATVARAAEYQFAPVNDPLPVSAGPNVGFFCAYLRDPHGLTFEVIGPRLK
ncbi:VOC family protein [Cupriavidus sp. UYPR2.512]|uniref:VOC family protein n=1 Tax=Cupriavidus sp. UYPR2.512 TaxID=1080187 RepID=UPI0009D9FA71|nr:VOC family protein [Cupriavidus sp. UYPR2.512]UIF90007.1 VOC family protein [Cupriavidus necator]